MFGCEEEEEGSGLVWFDGGVVVTACSRLVVVFDRRLDFGERAVTCVLVGCQQQTRRRRPFTADTCREVKRQVTRNWFWLCERAYIRNYYLLNADDVAKSGGKLKGIARNTSYAKRPSQAHCKSINH